MSLLFPVPPRNTGIDSADICRLKVAMGREEWASCIWEDVVDVAGIGWLVLGGPEGHVLEDGPSLASLSCTI